MLMYSIVVLSMLILAFGAYCVARIAEDIQQRLHSFEDRLVQKPNVETPPSLATIRPQRQTIDRSQTMLPDPTTQRRDTRGLIDRHVPQPIRAPAQTATVKAWVSEWRRAVVLLARWGERSMNDARLRLEIGDYGPALDTIATGVERMSRALLRCFGEKADLETGQMEPLRLVSLRLTGEERVKFEAAVKVVAKIHQVVKAQKFLSEHKTDVALLDAERVRTLLESASKVVTLFAQILHEHFASEIPELRECCPKCFSVDVTLWAFSQSSESYTCSLCGHKWT